MGHPPNLAFRRASVSVDDFPRSRSQESPLFRLIKTNFDLEKYARMEFSVGTGVEVCANKSCADKPSTASATIKYFLFLIGFSFARIQ
jgi:hypothetical protein